MTTEPLRIPLAHSVRYVVRGLPDVPYQYGRGVLRPSEITLTYRTAPDSQLGRVHAYIAGRLRVDGAEIQHAPYGQHYDSGLDSWPAWLTEEARLHDPDAAVSSAPADRAELRDRIAEGLLDHLSRTADIRRGDDGELAFMLVVTDAERMRLADAVLAVRDREMEQLRRDRDLAIAHDRQPYPTAWAYEQACKSLHRKEAAIERVLEFAASLDETGRQIAGPDAVHPVAAHIRHLLDTPPAVGVQQPKEADGERVVAYRSALPGALSLYCTNHTDELGDGAMPLTSDDLPDGGICTACGVDVLIPQQPKETEAL